MDSAPHRSIATDEGSRHGNKLGPICNLGQYKSHVLLLNNFQHPLVLHSCELGPTQRNYVWKREYSSHRDEEESV